MKELTIIVPVYNAENHIAKCLYSILPQLKEKYELLLINDGSTDKSMDILELYQKKNPKSIRIIDKENTGVAETRNLGIREARGEFICFIDNDDYVDKEYFSTFLNAINTSEMDLVMGGYRRVGKKEIKFVVKPVDSKWFKFTVPAPWAKIYRKEFLLKNEIKFLNYKSGEDIYFCLDLFAKTDKIKVIDYIGYNWFYNEESVSNTIQKGFNKKIDVVELMNKLYSVGKNKDEYFQYFYVRYLVWYLLFSGKTASKEDFMNEYVREFRWLTEKKIPIKYPFYSSKLKGERISVRLSVAIFLMLHKVHLIGLFASIFCKN